jgi:hypothetical protein
MILGQVLPFWRKENFKTEISIAPCTDNDVGDLKYIYI